MQFQLVVKAIALKWITPLPAAVFLCAGWPSFGADVSAIFHEDSESVLVVSKSPHPEGGTILYVMEPPRRMPLAETDKAEIIGRSGLQQLLPSNRGDIVSATQRGLGILVRGLDEYEELFFDAPADWPYVAVVRSSAGQVEQSAAVEPLGVAALEAMGAEAPVSDLSCAAGQSDSEPTVPRTPDAIARIEANAEAGDPDAQWQLGILFEEGQFGPQDAKTAAQWFEKSAAQCNKFAQNSLGRAPLLRIGRLPTQCGRSSDLFREERGPRQRIGHAEYGDHAVQGRGRPDAEPEGRA